ncbi:MAG TPA: carboxypeptidase-like regulatory domain-containing protein, partial [Chryseosolibacter sp.]
MKNASTFTFFIFFLQLTAYSQASQKSFIISGSVADNQGMAIPFANAAVYNNLDSALVGGAASDENGEFAIQIRPGNYYMKISFLSYQEKIIPNVNVINGDIDLGTVVLQPDSRLLETVEIEGQRSQMELQLDKRVFNVGSDLSTSGG